MGHKAYDCLLFGGAGRSPSPHGIRFRGSPHPPPAAFCGRPHRGAAGPRFRCASAVGEDSGRRQHLESATAVHRQATSSRASWRGSLGESSGIVSRTRGFGCQTLKQHSRGAPLPTPAAAAAAPSLRDGAPGSLGFSVGARLHTTTILRSRQPFRRYVTARVHPGGGAVLFGGFEANPPPRGYDPLRSPSRLRPLCGRPTPERRGPHQIFPTQPSHVPPGGGAWVNRSGSYPEREGLGARP